MRKAPFLLLLASAIPAMVATAATAAEATWVADARSVASAMPPKLLKVLTDEISANGPESAISLCRDKAPLLAKAASEQSGWQVRRVSLNNRNPKAVPDAWEQATLADFDRRAAAGEAPATLERAEAVPDANGQTVWRYMRALPTQEMCLACHGTPERVSAGVKVRLAELYPYDHATGYRLGQIRGAITLRQARP